MTVKEHAAEWWRKGTACLAAKDFNGAIEWFSRCVQYVPEHLAYRQHLRGAEREKYGNNQSGAKMSGLRLKPLKGKIALARAKKNWAEVDKMCEEGLKLNPWDASLNSALAESAHERGFLDVAVFAAQCAVQMEPNNTTYLRQLGLLLEEKGEFAEAVKPWEHILKLDPNDGEARSKVGHLHTKATMRKGGYEDASSTRDITTEQQQKRRSAYEDYQKKTETVKTELTTEEQLQRMIRKEPQHVEHYLKLAQYYDQEKEHQKAFETYQQAVEVSHDDPDVREQMYDAELRLLRHRLEETRIQAETDKDRAALPTLAKELLEREVAILSFKEERHPQDMRIKLELAQRFMQSNQFPEAIKRLQQAVHDTRLTGEAQLLLGKCFGQVNQPKLALINFEKAVELLSPQDQPKKYCEAHYYAGILHEAQGNTAKAEEHFTAVLSVDYSYKDAGDRLVKLQGGDQAGVNFMQ